MANDYLDYNTADQMVTDEEEKRRRRENPTVGEAIGQGFDRFKERFTDSSGDFSLGKTIASGIMGGTQQTPMEKQLMAGVGAPPQPGFITGVQPGVAPAIPQVNTAVSEPQNLAQAIQANGGQRLPTPQFLGGAPIQQTQVTQQPPQIQQPQAMQQPQPDAGDFIAADQSIRAPMAVQPVAPQPQINPAQQFTQQQIFGQGINAIPPQSFMTAPGVVPNVGVTPVEQAPITIPPAVNVSTQNIPTVDPFASAGYDERVMNVLSNPHATEDELGQLRYDPTVSADVRQTMRERMEPLLRAQLEMPKANAVINQAATDPAAAKKLSSELASDKPEGSWIKAILLAKLGMTDLAQEEFIKLGLGDSNTKSMVDGEPVTVVRDGKGRVKYAKFISGDKEGQRVSGEQLTQVMIEGNDPRVKVGDTKYQANVNGKVNFFKEIKVGSQTYWQNETTGGLSRTAPEGLTKFGERDPLERQAGEAATAAISKLLERKPHASQQEIDALSNSAYQSVMRAGGRLDTRNQQGGSFATGGGAVSGAGQTGTYGRGDGSAASVNNPTGLGAQKDANGNYVWKSYSTPQEGVADTQRLVGTYLSGQGPMSGVAATPENFVGTWVHGPGALAQNPNIGRNEQGGRYAAGIRQELANAGVKLNADGTIPNTPEANNAVTRALITYESGADKARAFLPYVGGKGEPTQVASAVTNDAGPTTITTNKLTNVLGEPIKRIASPNPKLTPGEQQEIEDIATGNAPIPTDKDNAWKAEEARRQFGSINPLLFKSKELDVGTTAKGMEKLNDIITVGAEAGNKATRNIKEVQSILNEPGSERIIGISSQIMNGQDARTRALLMNFLADKLANEDKKEFFDKMQALGLRPDDVGKLNRINARMLGLIGQGVVEEQGGSKANVSNLDLQTSKNSQIDVKSWPILAVTSELAYKRFESELAVHRESWTAQNASKYRTPHAMNSAWRMEENRLLDSMAATAKTRAEWLRNQEATNPNMRPAQKAELVKRAYTIYPTPTYNGSTWDNLKTKSLESIFGN